MEGQKWEGIKNLVDGEQKWWWGRQFQLSLLSYCYRLKKIQKSIKHPKQHNPSTLKSTWAKLNSIHSGNLVELFLSKGRLKKKRIKNFEISHVQHSTSLVHDPGLRTLHALIGQRVSGRNQEFGLGRKNGGENIFNSHHYPTATI